MFLPIDNEVSLRKFVEDVLQECLQEIAKETVDYLSRYVDAIWYKNHFPATYQRTYQLLDSITNSEIRKLANGTYKIDVFFDTSKITPNFLANGGFNEHMGFDGRPFTQGLVETIEEGNSSPYSPDYAEDGIHMFEFTAKWLEKNLPPISKKIFYKYGINIVIS